MSIERIVAAVVDTQLLTLYREDGSTIEIKQGDPRVRGIIDQVMPVVQSGGTAEVDLSHLPNAYKDFEEKSSGLVRLFRVAKKKVADLFSRPDEEDIEEMFANGGVFGQIPVSASVPQPVSIAAVEEILEQAEAVASPDFKEADTTEDHTMIAVVEDAGKKTIVPGVEAIKEQFAYFGGKGSTQGMEAFMKRIAAVIEKRHHSVQDLLRFLEKGDLPIADDGCIVAYKRLITQRGGSYREGGQKIFVDPHTRCVTQRPGSIVVVDESLVDLNRRNECSNGLHIGRRGYMGGFNGDAMFMCKIAPEDVMVVPHNDANKVRVKAYHIIAQLNEKAFGLICRNQPATSDPATAQLLSDVIAGKHKPADQEVRITQQRGGGLQIRDIVNGKVVETKPSASAQQTQHRALDDVTNTTADPKNVAAKVTEVKAGASRRDKAAALLTKVQNRDVQAAAELLALKKTSKVSWDSLGVPANMVDVIIERASLKDEKPQPLSAVVAAPKEQASVAKAKGERAQKIEAFERIMKDTTKAHHARFNAGQDLIAFRKRAKVSWTSLGRSDLTDDGIIAYINDLPKSAPKPVPVPKAEAQKAKGPTTAPATATAPKTISGGPSQQEAQRLYNAKKWTELAAFKKAKKKSWAALGFSSQEEAEIKLHIGD